ncbi:RagB/SusD family nutrient uptake outer membrane protein [Pedobacter sp. ASV28]|uniref:RagB/SusD family nutrient uptake outer membrane protein n=1 Tax=Pedobacter sp. ASV28 TaxID=2795123 RepID=UPI0018EBB408|nr:RagB/SusD family nutrient uptake outer membrane protein [Pedobacter sp. ASV28]
MKDRQVIKSIYLLPILYLLGIASIKCEKFVDIAPSPDLIATSAIFQDNKTATAAINGVYYQMRSSSLSLANGAISLYPGLSADEFFNSASNANTDPFLLNAILPTTGIIGGSFWRPAYQSIYKINSIIEGLTSSNALTDTVKKQLLGEAKFLRSFYYFQLVNLFGDVPLILSTNYQDNATVPRTPINTIYKQITTDLKEAKELLKSNYPASLRSRPNRWTATALLARVYLYLKDWNNAEIEATATITSGAYSLASLATVFQASSNETIWQILSEGANTAEGATFIPSSTTVRPPYIITNDLLNRFETGDNRKGSWLSSNTVTGQVYYYPFKYKLRTNTPINEYEIVFRLAEQYLIRAEARNEQNNFNGAKDDLNTIRTRAGLGNTTANDKSSIFLAIEKERQTEMFAEWGHRWFDLKRTDRANDILSMAKHPNWKSTAVWYPLPQSELLINTFLVQNPGY